MLSSKAIVLCREPFGEADLYVQFFTQTWGKITLLAKSGRKSKKRYVGGLDLFCHDEIFVKNIPKNPTYLQELVVLNSFIGIRESIEKLQAAAQLITWASKLTLSGTPLPRLYELMVQCLNLIEQESELDKLDLLILVFQIKFLGLFGMKPELDCCLACSRSIQTSALFDFKSGGALCPNCAPKSYHGLWLYEHDWNLLRNAYKMKLVDWKNFSTERNTQNLSRLLTRFTTFHTYIIP